MLSKELVRLGHQVQVLTAVPHYPNGCVPLEYRRRAVFRSIENGVEVIRIRVPSVNRANLTLRMFQFLFYQAGAAWQGLFLRYDVVFAANPALWVFIPFITLVVLRRKPALFSIYDIYPDIGVQLGIFKSRLVISLVGALEKFCLRQSRVVRIISQAFRPSIHRLGVPDAKIALVYDWVDTDLIQPMPRKNDFALQHKLADQFVVLYGGNLGLSQGLDFVLATAQRLAEHSDIAFVFVGEGSGRKHLEQEVAKKGLGNIRIFNFQPREKLPQVLASADISLVILRKGIGTDSLPSKTLSALASGRPVIASVDQKCETWDLINRAQAGLCIACEDGEELARAILTLKNNAALRESMGKNGRTWALDHHSPEKGAREIEKLLLSIVRE